LRAAFRRHSFLQRGEIGSDRRGADRTPALVAALGERASYRFFEFFTANIRNPHTRRAYARAAVEFFDWLHAKGVTRLTAIESVHVAAYIEQLQKERSAPRASDGHRAFASTKGT
jgi:site-specific recombinase XerD